MTPTITEAEYLAIFEATRQATIAFHVVREDYWSGRIGDAEFLAARAVWSGRIGDAEFLAARAVYQQASDAFEAAYGCVQIPSAPVVTVSIHVQE